MRLFELVLILSVFVSGCRPHPEPPVQPPYNPPPVVQPEQPPVVQPPITYPPVNPGSGENWASGYTITETGLHVTIAVNSISSDRVARVTWQAENMCPGCKFVGLDVNGRVIIVDYRSKGDRGEVDVIRRDLERVAIWALRVGR